MGAPVGNKNGNKTWFPPLSRKEKSVRVQSSVPKSQYQRLKDKCAEKSLKMTDAIREAIAMWLDAQGDD